jgi:D-glycero-D-manno-heptose 1,7-bisphosphate phosphatase
MNSSTGEPPKLHRAVFLDRDGVLITAIVREGRPYPPGSLAEMTLLSGVEDACARLRKSGFLLIVVSNQPDIARGAAASGEVAAINAALQAKLGLDEVCVCPHDDADACACRKPKPGLLLAAAERWKIDLANSFMVGDRWRDIEAGRAAGCRTVFIDYGYAERRPDAPDMVAPSLAAIVPEIIAAQERK